MFPFARCTLCLHFRNFHLIRPTLKVTFLRKHQNYMEGFMHSRIGSKAQELRRYREDFSHGNTGQHNIQPLSQVNSADESWDPIDPAGQLSESFRLPPSWLFNYLPSYGLENRWKQLRVLTGGDIRRNKRHKKTTAREQEEMRREVFSFCPNLPELLDGRFGGRKKNLDTVYHPFCACLSHLPVLQ